MGGGNIALIGVLVLLSVEVAFAAYQGWQEERRERKRFRAMDNQQHKLDEYAESAYQASAQNPTDATGDRIDSGVIEKP